MVPNSAWAACCLDGNAWRALEMGGSQTKGPPVRHGGAICQDQREGRGEAYIADDDDTIEESIEVRQSLIIDDDAMLDEDEGVR